MCFQTLDSFVDICTVAEALSAAALFLFKFLSKFPPKSMYTRPSTGFLLLLISFCLLAKCTCSGVVVNAAPFLSVTLTSLVVTTFLLTLITVPVLRTPIPPSEVTLSRGLMHSMATCP